LLHCSASALLVLLAACEPQPAPETPRVAMGLPASSAKTSAAPLTYLEEVVGDAAADAPLPLLVLIHGRGDRPQRGWLPLELPVPVRVIMPQAPLPFGDGFSWSAARASEAEGPSGAALARDLEARADAIMATLAVVQRQRPTRGLPLVAGFSQGGMLSYALAVRHPNAFALAIPIAGLLPRSLFPAKRPAGALPKLRALHGTADTIVPIAPARAAIEQLVRVGYDAQLIEQQGIEHTISGPMLAQLNAWLSEGL
jgi:phospholipase/carboxylesterase